MEGWIKIHRKLSEWEWYNDSKMVHLFLHLLLFANHKDGNFQGTNVKRGQVITGRHKLSASTGMSEQNIRTCLIKLESTNEITIETTNKNSLITLVNYNSYQNIGENLDQSTNGLTNHQPSKQPTINQPLTTNKNDKNEEEIKNGKILISFDLVLKCFETAKILARPYLDRMQEVHFLNGKQVIDYLKTWTSKNEGKTMTISHAENSFNIFLNGMQKEQPKLLYPLSSIKDNDF